MSGCDPTQRFTGRVDDYAKTRPSYPDGVLAWLRDHAGLGAACVVADLGSGTGLFTRLLLESGATVYAVEPNEEMRKSAEAQLAEWPTFHSVDGRAEATSLPDGSVDLVTAAQAFHWFDLGNARAEMKRILRPAGHVALVWNDRDLVSTAFLRAYEALLVARCPKYRELQGKADTVDKFDALFGRGGWSRHVVPNEQHLDGDGLVSRLLSSSYSPRPGEPGHDEAIAELREIFERHAQNGAVVMVYSTVIIFGQVR